MDKCHQTNPPTKLKSEVMGEKGTRKGLGATPCSAGSDTPETDGEADHAQNILIDCEREAYQTGGEVDAIVVPVCFARRLERERDEARAALMEVEAGVLDGETMEEFHSRVRRVAVRARQNGKDQTAR